MKFGRLRDVVLATAALVALMSSSAFAAGVTLAWDPNDESDVAGYIIKYGDEPKAYRYQVDAGRATSVKLDGLMAGRTYYFAVQAYSNDGSKSALSRGAAVRRWQRVAEAGRRDSPVHRDY